MFFLRLRANSAPNLGDVLATEQRELYLCRALVHGSRFRRIIVVKPRSGVATDAVSETEPVRVREIPLPDIRIVLHLPLRQTEGFLRSLVDMLEVELPIPDHTTLSRRLKTLGALSFRAVASHRPLHLLIDSTGLKIHVGNLPKPPRHRAWRKLHLAVDAGTGEMVASDLTSRRTHDGTRVPALLKQIDHRVASISADGAYDTEGVYEAARAQGHGRHVSVVISPRRDARLRRRPSAALLERNRNIRSIRKLGRREWHKWSGYSKRSMVENAIYRYKTIIGRGLRSRTLGGQLVEVHLACRVLNTMTRLGMPDSYRAG